MKNTGAIQKAISEFAECFEIGNSVAFPTQHLYPSNRGVTVFVEPVRHDAFCVADNGGALEELSALGLGLPKPDRAFNATCRDYGVEVNKGVIRSANVPLAGISTAIVFVAAASVRVVEKLMERLKPERHRDLSKEIEGILSHNFSAEQYKKAGTVHGASNKQYEFDFVVFLPDDKQVLIDMVVPEIAAINAKVVSNIDVARNEDSALIQRIVFDDEDDWGHSDISLLQMAAVTVPFSGFNTNISSFMRH